MSSDQLNGKPQSCGPQGQHTARSAVPLARVVETVEPPVVATVMARSLDRIIAIPREDDWQKEDSTKAQSTVPVAIVASLDTEVEASCVEGTREASNSVALASELADVPKVTPPSEVSHSLEDLPVVATAEKAKSEAKLTGKERLIKTVKFPFWLAGSCLDLFSLLVLLSIVAAVPVLQLASLGYLLMAGGRLASGQPWRTALPGLRLAGKLGVYGLWAGLLFLPIILIQDLAQSAQILQPNSSTAAGWRVGAVLVAMFWLVHIGWAAMRGGRWWHFLWPGPLKFVTNIWRPKTWSKASDQLYDLVVGLQLPKLWWLGARATLGVLLWLVIPASMMIIGQRAPANIAPLIGLIGASLMIWVMYYLPFLQMLFVKTGKLSSFLAIGQVRRNYAYAPWAHFIALLILSAFAIPLYLLRIEDPPRELMWAPSLIFALLILPSKLLIGWAVGYAERRQSLGMPKRRWFVRWPAHLLGLGPIAFYVGALYVAQLVAKLGAPVMYLQHAFLVPSPF